MITPGPSPTLSLSSLEPRSVQRRISWCESKSSIDRLLVLGWSHSRYYVRSVFVEIVIDAIRDPAYTPIVVAALRNHQDAIDFVREQLLEHSLPQVVIDVLAA